MVHCSVVPWAVGTQEVLCLRERPGVLPLTDNLGLQFLVWKSGHGLSFIIVALQRLGF